MINLPMTIVRIEHESERDNELRGAIYACLGLWAQKNPSLLFKDVVASVSRVTGESEMRSRALRLVRRLIELGLLRQYRLVDDKLEFTELADTLFVQMRSRAEIGRQKPQPKIARKPASASSRKRGRWPGTVVGPEGLSERVEDALLDLDALADSEGLLPTGLALLLYSLWQERGSKFLAKDPNALYSSSVHPLIVKGLVERKVGAARHGVTPKGRDIARQIRHRRLRVEHAAG